LTGETASTGLIRPRHDFDPANHHWGAFQVAARISELSIDPLVFDEGLAGPTASRRTRASAIGISWYPNAYVKYMLMFEHTAFREGASRPDEHAVLARAQVAF
jgi:phosphate-selective porin OprO/OprP